MEAEGRTVLPDAMGEVVLDWSVGVIMVVEKLRRTNDCECGLVCWCSNGRWNFFSVVPQG